MSYNPQTGLVYIPAQYSSILFASAEGDPVVARNMWNVGIKPPQFPENPEAIKDAAKGFTGALLAWDPVKQNTAWKKDYPGMWNGGTLSTAGNLVFQGTSQGDVRAYAADTGQLLWKSPANTGVLAAPVTYKVDGEQYVTFMAGWGGAFTLNTGHQILAEGIETIAEMETLERRGVTHGQGFLPGTFAKMNR